MRHTQIILALLLCVLSRFSSLADTSPPASCRFEVSIKPGLISQPAVGRLFIILSATNNPDPRFSLGKTGPEAPLVLARDLKGFAPGDATVTIDEHDFVFPDTNVSCWLSSREGEKSAKCFIQALFDSNSDLRSPSAPGNLYSARQEVRLPLKTETIKLELSQQIPVETLPPETERIKFVKIQSKLLSDFHKRPIFLRAGIILPRDYERETSKKYPLWVRIGGLNVRYTSVTNVMERHSELSRLWEQDDTPRFILLQLDGAGPFGDPYQVNSANSGPYGDAVTQELIPHIEKTFRAMGQSHARVLSGTSTGGWVALALQIFYPDFFNGTWVSCPDPVDFRALELINIYEDENAFVNGHGHERPSERNSRGDVVLTMRQEVGMENLLGGGNSYTLSGEQWGAWNATFGPRGANGLPVPLWDPKTGKIDHSVAEHWKNYDLRLFLEKNWKALAPKLKGKLHIASGEADQYFLNNAMYLLDDFLHEANPKFEGKIFYGPRQPHGWYNLSADQVLHEMQAAVAQKSP